MTMQQQQQLKQNQRHDVKLYRQQSNCGYVDADTDKTGDRDNVNADDGDVPQLHAPVRLKRHRSNSPVAGHRSRGHSLTKALLIMILVSSMFFLYIQVSYLPMRHLLPTTDGRLVTEDDSSVTVHRRSSWLAWPLNLWRRIGTSKRRRKKRKRKTRIELPTHFDVDKSNADSPMTSVSNESLTYILSHPYPGVLAVRAAGNLSERLVKFNLALDQLRFDLWNEFAEEMSRNESPSLRERSMADRTSAHSGGRAVGRWPEWRNDKLIKGLKRNRKKTQKLVIVNEDDYVQKLCTEHPSVRTIVLPWLHTSGSNATQWNSQTDYSNLFIQVSVWISVINDKYNQSLISHIEMSVIQTHTN